MMTFSKNPYGSCSSFRCSARISRRWFARCWSIRSMVYKTSVRPCGGSGFPRRFPFAAWLPWAKRPGLWIAVVMGK